MRRLSLARVSGLIVVLVLGVTAIAAVARAITPAPRHATSSTGLRVGLPLSL